ncbi:MAG: protein kinase [Oscillatoriales cyanobacterium C42_A2020_001]|nr:protein kinase [Leptolyngbyaceae cyanobacterium C42_A2020_001]
MSNLAPRTDLHYRELNAPLDGRYQVIEVLTAKLWARTYLAQDLRRPSQSECVIHHLKTISMIPNYAETARELLTREAAILEHVGMHPQIPQLLAWFEDKNGFYVVQEFIQGRSLGHELQPGVCWQAEDVVQFVQNVLEPLAIVHRYGSMHGNLQPQSLLRRNQDGQLVLIDFHNLLHVQLMLIAAQGLVLPSLEGAQKGYQPLEQLQGLPCPASDIYAIGMIAIQALTGIQPVDLRVNPTETVEILWKEHLQPSDSLLQQKLVEFLDTMTQWDVTLRYGNADEALLALQELQQMCLLVKPPLVLEEDQNLSIAPALVPASVVEPAQPSTLVPVIKETSELALTPKPGRQELVFVKTLLLHAIASPSLRVSAGGIALATTCAAAGWGLLNSVDWSDKSTKLWDRFTRATDTASNPKQRSVKAVHQEWQKDWQQASTTFQKAEAAFRQGEWAEVKELSANLPDIPYWRDRGNQLAEKAISQAETESGKRMQTAYDYAYRRDFTKALAELNQILPETTVGQRAKAKITEYQEKQEIKAWSDLQKAYDRAIARDFSQALIYLYQIPKETAVHPVAQKKIAEYKQKEKIRAQILLNKAEERANRQQLQVAISSLQEIPSSPSIDAEVEVKIEVYRQRLNQQAESWLYIAGQQVRDGNVTEAIATLEKVPIGTAAYAQAREQIAELTALSTIPVIDRLKLEPTLPPEPARDRSDLNPGNQLRETNAMVVSWADFPN